MQILKFSASWCQPCKQLATVMASDEFKDLDVKNIDIDDAVDIAKSYNIRSVPTLVVLDEKGSEIGRTTGGKTAGQLKEFLNGINE